MPRRHIQPNLECGLSARHRAARHRTVAPLTSSQSPAAFSKIRFPEKCLHSEACRSTCTFSPEDVRSRSLVESCAERVCAHVADVVATQVQRCDTCLEEDSGKCPDATVHNPAPEQIQRRDGCPCKDGGQCSCSVLKDPVEAQIERRDCRLRQDRTSTDPAARCPSCVMCNNTLCRGAVCACRGGMFRRQPSLQGGRLYRNLLRGDMRTDNYGTNN